MAWNSWGTAELTVTYNLGPPENTASGTDLRGYHRIQAQQLEPGTEHW